jgi:hypothetical protein
MARARRPYESNIEATRQRVLGGAGALDALTRREIYDGGGPADLAAYLQKVRDHAYRVTDAEVEGLKRAGRSDDEIFEATVSAAMAAGMTRLDKVLGLLDDEA